MTIQLYDRPNRAKTTLAAPMTASQTAMTLLDGTRFPDPALKYIVVAFVGDDPAEDENAEYMYVTDKPGNYTVTRGELGTTGVEHAIGDKVQAVAASDIFDQIETNLQNVDHQKIWESGWASINPGASFSGPMEFGQAGITMGLSSIRAGSVTGVSLRASSTLTAGQATAEVYINGVATGLQAVMTTANQPNASATQAAGIDTFTAESRVHIVLTTDASLAPTTLDFTATLELWIPN